MGQRIRRPMAFQGLTKKVARTGNIPEHDFTTTEGTLYENCIRWNQESETYLSHTKDNRGNICKGRGQKATYVNNTISPPQDNTERFAITEDIIKTAQAQHN
eukprot:14734893-Heterocapsa_arctica.AAC.1